MLASIMFFAATEAPVYRVNSGTHISSCSSPRISYEERNVAVIYKSQSSMQGFVRVTFELPSSVWADRVCLAGDFNNWKQNDIRLQQVHSGNWQVSLDLLEGRVYEFCYIIDDQWRTDYHADHLTDHTYASPNSIVITDIRNLQLLPKVSGLITAD